MQFGFIFEVRLLALQTENLTKFAAYYGIYREAKAERTSEIFINIFVHNLFFFKSQNKFGLVFLTGLIFLP